MSGPLKTRWSYHSGSGSRMTQPVAGRLQVRDVGRLVEDVGDGHRDVDDRLGREPGHRRRAGVLEPDDAIAEDRPDPGLLAVEQAGPRGVVLDERDRPVSGA